jgi:hypothetical protein
VKYPIPNDWDGSSWSCYELQWPDSVAWLALLQGIITTLARGRTWEESSGSIAAIQAIGTQVIDRNFPLVFCGGEPVPPLPPEIIYAACGGIEEDNEMPCIDLSTLMKIEDGKLYVKDSCCEWVEIGSLEAVEETPPDGFADDLTPPPSYSACGKAVAVVDAIYLVANAMFEETDVSNPLSWYSDVRAACPGISLKSKFLLEGILDAMLLKELDYTEEEIFDAVSHQEIICRLERSLSATGTALTEAEFNAIDTAFNQELGFDVAIFGAAANAIGQSQLSNIAMAGSLSTDANCDCPSYAADPTSGWADLDWTVWIPLTQVSDLVITTPNSSLWTVNGGWYKADRDSGYQSPQLYINNHFDHDGSYITRVQITLNVPNQMDWIATKGWLQRTYQSQEIIGPTGLTGGDPSVGGNQYLQGSCNVQCNDATWPLKLGFEGDAAIPASQTLYITGIALGGTGLSPYDEPEP